MLWHRGNKITGTLHFSAHTNVYHRRILSDTFLGTVTAASEWGEPAYAPWDGTYHLDDANSIAAVDSLSSTEKLPFGIGRTLPQLTENTMDETMDKFVRKTLESALSEWEAGGDGEIGTKEPLTEEQMHEMIEMQQNFMYVCALCPVKLVVAAPIDPATKLPVPTPAPAKLSKAEQCNNGFCSFRLFYGSPCDEPSPSCLSTPALKIGSVANGNARDMSLFDEYYQEQTILLALNTSIEYQGYIQRAVQINSTEPP